MGLKRGYSNDHFPRESMSDFFFSPMGFYFVVTTVLRLIAVFCPDQEESGETAHAQMISLS